jgi:hypothetical protein
MVKAIVDKQSPRMSDVVTAAGEQIELTVHNAAQRSTNPYKLRRLLR